MTEEQGIRDRLVDLRDDWRATTEAAKAGGFKASLSLTEAVERLTDIIGDRPPPPEPEPPDPNAVALGPPLATWARNPAIAPVTTDATEGE